MATAVVVKESIVTSYLHSNIDIAEGNRLVAQFRFRPMKKREVCVGIARMIHKRVPTVDLALVGNATFRTDRMIIDGVSVRVRYDF